VNLDTTIMYSPKARRGIAYGVLQRSREGSVRPEAGF
jgi:hypothetical protein